MVINERKSALSDASINDDESITRKAERNVIGGLLLSPEKTDDILALLNEDDFNYLPTKTIFQAIKKIRDKNGGIDILSVWTKLQEEGKLELIGGELVLNHLADEVADDPSADIIEDAKTLRKKADQRRIRELGQMIMESASKREPNELLAEIDNAITALTPSIDRDIKVDLKSQKEEIMKEISDPDNFKQSTIFKGFRFKAGDVILLKGKTGHGKTAVALNITADLLMGAATSSEPLSVYYFTFEQQRKEIISWIAQIMGISPETLIDTRGDKLNVLYGISKITDIEAYVRKWTRLKGPLDLVVIDYDTYLEPVGRFDNEERRVNAISKALKRMAVKYDTSVLLLSQVSDDGKAKWGRVKEEDASVVINIETDDKQEKLLLDKEQNWSITLKVQKSRNGEFEGKTLTFDRKTRAVTPEERLEYE